jgi:hypothetical protein
MVVNRVVNWIRIFGWWHLVSHTHYPSQILENFPTHHLFDEMSRSQIFPGQLLSKLAWSSAVQFTPITDALLHHLFAPCGMEQLIVYPVVIEEGDACVAADVMFVSGCAASQAFADFDGRCMQNVVSCRCGLRRWTCCRPNIWPRPRLRRLQCCMKVATTLLPRRPLSPSTTPSCLYPSSVPDRVSGLPGHHRLRRRPVMASSDTTKLAIASARLVQLSAPVPVSIHMASIQKSTSCQYTSSASWCSNFQVHRCCCCIY